MSNLTNRPINKELQLTGVYQDIERKFQEITTTLKLNGIKFSSHLQSHWMRVTEYITAILAIKDFDYKKIINIGGAGTIIDPYLLLNYKNVEIYSTDILEYKVDSVRNISTALGKKYLGFNDNIIETKMNKNYFDLALYFSVIEHIEKHNQLLSMININKLLKEGGELFFTFNYGEDRRTESLKNEKEVIDLVSGSGFEFVGTPFDNDGFDYRHKFIFATCHLKKIKNYE